MEIEKSINAVKQITKVKTKSSNEIRNELKAKNKDFAEFTKTDISEFSKSLSIKNIIRFIEKTMKKGGFETNTFLQKLIIQYTTMSSFVHGGLFAHKKMVSLENEKERKEALIGICGIALQSATFIKTFNYLTFYQFMPEFGIHYNNSNEIIKEMNK